MATILYDAVKNLEFEVVNNYQVSFYGYNSSGTPDENTFILEAYASDLVMPLSPISLESGEFKFDFNPELQVPELSFTALSTLEYDFGSKLEGPNEVFRPAGTNTRLEDFLRDWSLSQYGMHQESTYKGVLDLRQFKFLRVERFIHDSLSKVHWFKVYLKNSQGYESVENDIRKIKIELNVREMYKPQTLENGSILNTDTGNAYVGGPRVALSTSSRENAASNYYKDQVESGIDLD